MENFLERRAAAYGAIGMGFALMLAAFVPEMPLAGAIFFLVVGAALMLGSAYVAWRQRKRRVGPLSPDASSRDALFEFEDSDVEMEDTTTEGDRPQVRSKGGTFKSKRWRKRDGQ